MKPIDQQLTEIRDGYLSNFKPFENPESEPAARIAAEIMAVLQIEKLALSLADESTYREIMEGSTDFYSAISGSETRANRLSERLIQSGLPARMAECLSKLPGTIIEVLNENDTGFDPEYIADLISNPFGRTGCDLSELPSELPEVLSAMLEDQFSEGTQSITSGG